MNIPFKPIRTVIVDDDSIVRANILKYLNDEPDIEIVGECTNGFAAIECIKEKQPDLLFLEIQIPNVNGFEVLQSIKHDQKPYVVIVTSDEQYALRAFDYFAIDYLLKPFDCNRLNKTLDRVRRILCQSDKNDTSGNPSSSDSINGKQSYPERFMIKLQDKIIFIKIQDVDWIESAGNYIRLHIGKETHLLRETMNNIEKKLDPEKFVRIHRSSIVNVDRIQELQTWFNGEYCVILENGEKLTLGKKYKEQFKTMFV